MSDHQTAEADGPADREADREAGELADREAGPAVPLPEKYGRRPVSERLRRRLAAAFPVYAGVGLAPFGPSGFLLPSDARPFLERYYNTPVDPDDVWIVTLPKCGESMCNAERM